MVDISYFIRGFREPVKRKVDITDPSEVERFLNSLSNNPERKRDLEKLYELSDNIHSHKLCGPDDESLDNMVKELDSKGFMLKDVKNN